MKCGDNDANPGGKPHDHRVGYELNQAAHSRQAKCQQNNARHAGHQKQPADPVGLGDRQQDHHKGGSRTGYIEARTAGQGDDQPANDAGIQPMLRRHAHRYCQRHGQRNGNDANGYAGQQVTAQRRQAVAFTKAFAQSAE